MSGLSLNVGAYGGPMAQGGIPSAAGAAPGVPTIGKRAFGVYSQQAGDTGPRTAGLGTVALGLIGAGVLVFLWYSLPR